MLLATTGGHLEQLDRLVARLPEQDACVWVTHTNEQSRSLLAGREVEFVPYVRGRSIPDVLRCVPAAHRLLRERGITRAVSTGSGIALGFLPYLAARGVECHYIESAARVATPSLTGRLLERVPGIHRYAQYPQWARSRWTYGGSVFDSFRPTGARPAQPLGEALRVVVTVGTAAEFPFARLVRALVPVLTGDGALARVSGRPVEVLWQTGCTPTDGLPIAPSPFLGARELSGALAEADIVISHAGTGSALSILAAGRHPVLVGRRARWREAGDDHQGQLAAELRRRGLATVREPEAITAEDLLQTMSASVGRCGDPPRFELRS